MVVVGLGLFVRSATKPRVIPGSAGGPHAITSASGRSPQLSRQGQGGAGGDLSGRADRIIHDLRARAADQLIEHIGGAYAPDALKALLDEYEDPSEAVSRLIDLLGEDPAKVVAGPGEDREAFLDRLDAFVRLETEIRMIDADGNRQLFAMLREGRASDVRHWAAALHNATEAGAMLVEVKALAPGAIGTLPGLEARVDALSRQAREFMPANIIGIASAAEEVRLSTQALLRFTNDWHQLDRRREAAENEIGPRWDVDDPFCQSLLPSLEPIYASLEDAWKAIGHKRTTVAELRGILHDMEKQIGELERVAGELKRHHDHARAHPGAGSGSGPHRRRSSGYGPDGRDKGARAHADSKQRIWEFFGFRTRPTYEQCLARRNQMLKEHHPDIAGPAGAEMTRKIFDMWTAAKGDLGVDVRV